jgi:catechol 2,3-dioxygenase-like lactoylglutathione lyase family enzyme
VVHVARISRTFSLLLALAVATAPRPAAAQAGGQADARESMPRLHHVGLNSVDPERAIAWYLRLWPAARRTEVAGQPAVEADMLLLFNRVDRPPLGAWRDDLHRSESQSAFWHIGAFTNTTETAVRLESIGVRHLPLYTSPADTTGVWRSGLSPYAGTLTATQLATAGAAPPRAGGFSYVVAPDGVLFELTGGPDTRDSFSHVHFFHEQPLCAANWYVLHLGMELPPSRGQALDHIAFTVEGLDALLDRLRRAGVVVIEEPYAFGDARAFMIADPDGLAIELIERRGATQRGGR